jgi:hypothetical protein
MRELPHLVRRFFLSLRTRPLDPAEQAEAAALLRPEERDAFWSQPALDQRHALESARAAGALAPGRPDLIRAALLHDLGKRHAHLGVLGRSLASGLQLLRLPTPGRLRRYLNHGPIAAEELADAGSEAVVVAYARDHHRHRPVEVDPADWEVLVAADHGERPLRRSARNTMESGA